MNGQSEVTQVPADRQGAFRVWLDKNGITDLDATDSHYDYRGAFMAGLNRGTNGHWPDTFKQHGHPTFSVESQYSSGPNDGGHWQGERFISSAPVRRSMSDYTPEQWHSILRNAHTALAKNPKNAKARTALKAAVHAVTMENAQLNHADSTAANDPGALAAAGLGASQGATMGFGDELAGLLFGAAALGGASLTGQSPSEAYQQQVQATRNTTDAASQRHPLAYLGGEIAGGLAAPLPAGVGLGKIIKPGTTVVGRIASKVARSALTGGSLGAVEGAGRTEGGLAERARYAGIGGAVGLLAGAALPIGGAAAIEGARPITNVAKRMVKRLAGAAPKVEKKVAEEAEGLLPYYSRGGAGGGTATGVTPHAIQQAQALVDEHGIAGAMRAAAADPDPAVRVALQQVFKQMRGLLTP